VCSLEIQTGYISSQGGGYMSAFNLLCMLLFGQQHLFEDAAHPCVVGAAVLQQVREGAVLLHTLCDEPRTRRASGKHPCRAPALNQGGPTGDLLARCWC
jgi:hypothetical protein